MKIIHKIIIYIKSKIRSLQISYYVKSYGDSKNRLLKCDKYAELSDSELKGIRQFLGNDYTESSLICYKFYKFFGIFDPHLMPNHLYAEAERLLNPFRYSLFLQHKCNLKHYIPEANRPKTIIQNIDGHFFDKTDNPITLDESVSIARNHLPFFIKIAAGSGGGRGIQKISVADNIDKLFVDYKKDFILQEPLKEHPTLSRYNPDCINTIRVLSLNINDKCSILSSFIRMGGLGSIVDNLHSSEGTGVLVGVKNDGRLHEFGVDKYYNKIYMSPMGEYFDGLSIEYYDKVKDFILYWHQKSFPFANLIGWDIILDQNSNPVVIEINLDSADIAAHQVFNGPIFGERTEEVIEYMKNNPQKLAIRV